jgi:hypothetical protein
MPFPSSVRRLLLGALLPLSWAWAQFDTGTILGTVRDSSGAIVAGASVAVINEGTAARQAMKTTDSGTYTFSPLKIGKYTIEVEHPGFQKIRRTGVQLDIQPYAYSWRGNEHGGCHCRRSGTPNRKRRSGTSGAKPGDQQLAAERT